MDADARIGRNLVVLRGERSQKDVADAMRARGWKWSQATVWSIEKGERPLRLAEAADLANVLGVADEGAEALLRSTHETFARSNLRDVDDAAERLRAAMLAYEQTRFVLARYVDLGNTDLEPDTIKAITQRVRRGLETAAKEFRAELYVGPDGSPDQPTWARAEDGDYLTAFRKAK